MQTSLLRDLKQIARAKPPPPPAEPIPGCPDPIIELRLKRNQLKSVTEVHFSGREVESIHPNFQLLSNLEVLWLNDNKLTKVTGLLPSDDWKKKQGTEKMSAEEHRLGVRRLKHLNLSNNKIFTLVGDITRLKFLESLFLANNKLGNMEAVVDMLQPLINLQQLDLFGNPLAEEAKYRHYIIFHKKGLQVLDRRSVSHADRVTADKLFSTAAQAASKGAFGSTAPVECQSPEVIYNGKRWRRIWHRSEAKGVFDLRTSLIRNLAERATQVHIRTEGIAVQSVTSKENTYPIQRLRQGLSISAKGDGSPVTEADVIKNWTGNADLLKYLSPCGAEADRPLSRVLYISDGGLNLYTAEVGDGWKCEWTRGDPRAIEVYLDFGKEEEASPRDISVCTRELEYKVAKIKGEKMSQTYKEKDLQTQLATSTTTKRANFQKMWSARLGKSAPAEDAQKRPDGTEDGKQRVARAMAVLGMDTSEEAVERQYKEVHKGEQPSCLYAKMGLRESAFTETEPFIPMRDSDCFAKKYLERKKCEAEAEDNERIQEAVTLFIDASELETLSRAFGEGVVDTAVVQRSEVNHMIDLCMQRKAGTSHRVLPSDVLSTFGDKDALPLREALGALVICEGFVEYSIDQIQQQASKALSEGKSGHAKMLLHRMNKATDFLQYLKRRKDEPRIEGVGSALAGRPRPSHQQPMTTKPVKKVVTMGEPSAPPAPTAFLPPAGDNPRLGTVGAAVGAARRELKARDCRLMIAVAGLSAAAVAGVIKGRRLPSSGPPKKT